MRAGAHEIPSSAHRQNPSELTAAEKNRAVLVTPDANRNNQKNWSASPGAALSTT
jgi:hypothetical protein